MVLLFTLYSACTVFFYMFLRNVYKLLVILPGTKSMKKIAKISEIGKEKKDIYDYFSRIVSLLTYKASALAGRYILFSGEYETQKLAHDLMRTGSDDTPERFRVKQFLTPFMYLAAGGGVSVLCGILPGLSQVKAIGYIMWSTTIIIAFLSIYTPTQELNRKVDAHNERVIREIPRFIRTYRYSPDNMDLIKVIGEYLGSGESFLKYDFKQLVSSVNSGISIESALDEFARNISIPVVTELTIVLKSSIKNKKQSAVNLEIIENKIIELNEEYIEKELRKRPEILETINGALNYALMLLIFVPMLLYTIRGMSAMLK